MLMCGIDLQWHIKAARIEIKKVAKLREVKTCHAHWAFLFQSLQSVLDAVDVECNLTLPLGVT